MLPCERSRREPVLCRRQVPTRPPTMQSTGEAHGRSETASHAHLSCVVHDIPLLIVIRRPSRRRRRVIVGRLCLDLHTVGDELVLSRRDETGGGNRQHALEGLRWQTTGSSACPRIPQPGSAAAVMHSADETLLQHLRTSP